MRPEHALQMAVATYLAHVLPGDAVWTSIDAGQGRMDAIAAALRKARGVRPGWPDIQILYRGTFFGIELKADRGPMRESQRQRHREITAAGGKVAVCRSVANVEEMLLMWGFDTRFHALSATERDRMLADRAAHPVKRPNTQAERTRHRVTKRAMRFAAKAQEP